MPKFNIPTKSSVIDRTQRFLTDTSGAVTVDWVAITGAVLALVIAFFAYFNGEMGNVSTDLITKITSHL